MEAHRKAGAFVRAHKLHFIAAHALAVIGLLAAFLLGAFAGPKLWTVYGVKLDKNGVALYHSIAAGKTERGQRTGVETLPAAQAAAIAVLNDQVAAASATHPHPLATPEPVTATSLVRNYSSRSAGTRPILLVVHDTESPNAPGLADVKAIAAWFNNPVSQASSNYTTDADGNTLELVPDTKKAWTQAYFNSWAISDELIGHASQTTWPDAQLRAVARIFAAAAKRWGIPIQQGAVSGCTIVRAGIVDHLMLGACGGGHHDNGPDFPLTRFIGLMKAYAAPAVAPGATKPAPKPVPKAIPPATLRARTGYWSWLAWRLGQAAWKPYGTANPTVRPHVPSAIPAAWWRQLANHVKGAH